MQTACTPVCFYSGSLGSGTRRMEHGEDGSDSMHLVKTVKVDRGGGKLSCCIHLWLLHSSVCFQS